MVREAERWREMAGDGGERMWEMAGDGGRFAGDGGRWREMHLN